MPVILRIVLAAVFLVVLTGVAYWTVGPREPVDLSITFDPEAIGADPDAYLARQEANVPNLRAKTAKEIVWAYPNSKAKTPLAIIYVHGFSASKEEVRPLPDDVAEALGANLFFTRLTGHGRDSAALEQTSVNDWINDLAEAVAIGRRIGERVAIISTSTGGTLTTLGATLPGLMKNVSGIVEISPNFGLRNRWAFLLDVPFARELVPLIAGRETRFTPLNEEMAAFWTTSYPTAALVPMAALVKAALAADIGAIKIPALFIYSPADKIVDAGATERVIARWGAPHLALQVPINGDPSNHILAGRIVSPKTTAEIAERIVAWIKALPAE